MSVPWKMAGKTGQNVLNSTQWVAASLRKPPDCCDFAQFQFFPRQHHHRADLRRLNVFWAKYRTMTEGTSASLIGSHQAQSLGKAAVSRTCWGQCRNWLEMVDQLDPTRGPVYYPFPRSPKDLEETMLLQGKPYIWNHKMRVFHTRAIRFLSHTRETHLSVAFYTFCHLPSEKGTITENHRKPYLDKL